MHGKPLHIKIEFALTFYRCVWNRKLGIKRKTWGLLEIVLVFWIRTEEVS